MNSRLLDHCCAITDGTLTAEALADLESILRTNDAARRDYIDFMRLQALLERNEIENATLAPMPITPTLRARRSRARSVWYAAALAAVLTLALTAWFILPRENTTTPSDTDSPTPHSFALLSACSNDAVFDIKANTVASLNPGDALTPSPIRLQTGSAQVMFNSTAVVDLRGPCTFQPLGPNHARLTAGSASVYVPQRARGFILDTALGVRIVDLGTAFEVTQRPDGKMAVVVTEGKIRLESDHDRFDPLVLTSPQRAVVTTDGLVQPQHSPIATAGHIRLWNPAFDGPVSEFRSDDTVALIPESIVTDLAGKTLAVVPPTVGRIARFDREKGSLHVDRPLDAYSLVFHPVSGSAENQVKLTAVVEFDRPIVGLIVSPQAIKASNAWFASTNSFIRNGSSSLEDDADQIIVSDDHRTLTLHLTARTGADHLRVLTESASTDSPQPHSESNQSEGSTQGDVR